MPQSDSISPARLAAIQPMVLVGGASARFGRNKLLEPMPSGGVLVDRPIQALRAVFGPRVALVGNCVEQVSARGELAVPDTWPQMGPAGGIASALAHFQKDVFVLAGDLPAISERTIRRILKHAAANPGAAAVLACSHRPEPCIGLYRRAALAPLERSLQDGASLSVLRRLEGLAVTTALVPAEEVVNANTPEQLREASEPTLMRGLP